jgi:hypothetical protein
MRKANIRATISAAIAVTVFVLPPFLMFHYRPDVLADGPAPDGSILFNVMRIWGFLGLFPGEWLASLRGAMISPQEYYGKIEMNVLLLLGSSSFWFYMFFLLFRWRQMRAARAAPSAMD